MKKQEIKALDITVFKKAYSTFAKFMQHDKTEQDKAGIIQAFEFCYELSWKIMKRFLYNEGIEVNSPRATFREAAKSGLIKDVKLWFSFLDQRNKTVHTYDEQILNQIIAIMPKFKKEMETLIKALEDHKHE